MTFRSRSLKLLLACGIAVTARSAGADPSPTELAAARHAFETAVELEADQKWAAATVKLQAALAIKDTPGLRFHLAHCEDRQGLLVEASSDYDRASELLRRGARAPDVQKLLLPASAELKRRIPQLSVDIPRDLSNPVAELDGKAYAPSELALGQALNPGPHQLKVSANGHNPFERAFSVKEGDQVSIRAELPSNSPVGAFSLAAAPSAASIRLDSPPAPRRAQRSSPKLYLLVGESVITAAGLALGIGYELAEASARERVRAAQGRIDQAAQSDDGACSAPGAAVGSSCTDLRVAIDDHDRDATVSSVGFACAGLGAVAFITTWLAYPSPASNAGGPSVQPLVALGRIGLQGRF